MGRAAGVVVGPGHGGRDAHRWGPRVGVLGRGHQFREAPGIRCRVPPPCGVFLGFKLLSQTLAMILTEPGFIQVAWSPSMSWCRACLMVPHVLRWVVWSRVWHPGWMRSILAFARAVLTMFSGEAPSGLLPPVGFVLLCRGTRLLWRGWCQTGSGCHFGPGGL